MPRIDAAPDPFWQTSDRSTVRLWLGDVLATLRGLPSGSVQCVTTSPPYWGLRSYDTADGKHLELGSEARPDCLGWARGYNCAESRDGVPNAWASGCHVCRMVLVFREVRRVLRDDGTCWLNYGDSYSSGGAAKRDGGHGFVDGGKVKLKAAEGMVLQVRADMSGIPSGNLVGVPWRVALALQADGWVLRQDIIWCLSGGTWLYVRSQKGEMPMMLRDAARLNPSTVQLWNGERWTQVLGWSCSSRNANELELVLRSGERISCTPSHKFPTERGLLEAGQLKIGDVLGSAPLPEPVNKYAPRAVPLDAAWFIGLCLAEANWKDGKIYIAGHVKEIERWEKAQEVVRFYGGSCTLRTDGNNQTITVYGKMLVALLEDHLSGTVAKDKALKVKCWAYSNEWLLELLGGYLSGDGHWDAANDRWRLGFCRNYSWERDLRVLAARLGFRLILNTSFADCDGKKFPTFRGEIRFVQSGHWNEKRPTEVVEIRNARCREVWDVGVADAPNVFALASGVLTHNSKPSPMPESVRNRCTKAHEYVFLLTKGQGYYCDMEAIKDRDGRFDTKGVRGYREGVLDNSAELREVVGDGGRFSGSNKRSVWTVASSGYAGAHFATFPPKLIEPMILAGTSAHGACAKCGAPWRRVVKETKLTRERPRKYVANDVAGVEVETVGWEPACKCGTETVVPCVVLDPFLGSGTTALVSLQHGRRAWGIDLSEAYLLEHAIPRVLAELERHAWCRGLEGVGVGQKKLDDALAKIGPPRR